MSRLVLAVALVLAGATVAPAGASELPAPVFRPEAPAPEPTPRDCEPYWITGYVRTAPYHSPRTYDGTPIWTEEAIVAASWNLPIDAVVEIAGLGRFRVADRGHLGARHIDVAVWTYPEAYALTGEREVCRVA